MRWIFIFILSITKICSGNIYFEQHQDHVTVAASKKYSSPSILERIFFGSNYRKEWETPVKMPVLDLQNMDLQIVEMGGGQQTTSLELADESGREWALRSVDKDVKPPGPALQNRVLLNIIQDQVSGAYPYAGLSVPDIAHAAGVPAGEQHLYFVPDDNAFGVHRSAMANRVFILVNRQPGVQENISTDTMMKKLKNDPRFYVDQEAYLKARMVDWLVADWDRHDDQWRWTEKKTDSGFAFHIVPRDRDQAFFRSNGLLVKFFGLFFLPHINKFNKSARGIKGLSTKSWQYDQEFTNRLTRKDWEKMIKEFQKNVSDSVIETAMRRQPPEIFAIRGDKLIKKLQSRRDGLLKHSMKYYDFLHR